MVSKFSQLFDIQKPIIGMIHLAGKNEAEKVSRALEEMNIYQEEGVNGVIIEDYHGSPKDVLETLRQSSTQGFNLVRGVNVLRNPYSSFKSASEFGARFVQFDSVQTKDLDIESYTKERESYPNILVLGGVGFKYISPTGNPLEVDLAEATSRCDAVVTTGSGTGVETPIDKLRQFREKLGEFPLIVGAGVTLDNIYEQLQLTDGAIIGSYFKSEGNTQLPIDRRRVKDLMDIVREARG